jgi:hypothetical protein
MEALHRQQYSEEARSLARWRAFKYRTEPSLSTVSTTSIQPATNNIAPSTSSPSITSVFFCSIPFLLFFPPKKFPFYFCASCAFCGHPVPESKAAPGWMQYLCLLESPKKENIIVVESKKGRGDLNPRLDTRNKFARSTNFMNPSNTTPNPNGYRLSFIINAAVGGLMLMLSATAYVLEILHPQLRGTLAWGFMFTAVLCLFISSLHYSKFLSLKR